jgi:hypothetical protein
MEWELMGMTSDDGVLCVAAEIYAMHNMLSSFMLRCDIAPAPLTRR